MTTKLANILGVDLDAPALALIATALRLRGESLHNLADASPMGSTRAYYRESAAQYARLAVQIGEHLADYCDANDLGPNGLPWGDE